MQRDDAHLRALEKRNTSLALRLEACELQNAALIERVAELENALIGADQLAPMEWRLTPSEHRVFCVLVRKEVATKDAIMAALYEDTLRDRAQEKIVDVFVCKMRKKVEPFGVTIQTVWGRGYQLVNRASFARAA